MEPGKKYRIITRIVPGVCDRPREMVFRFLYETDSTYVWDARPEAGNQEMPKVRVAAIYEVHEEVAILLPKIYRVERRVL